MCGCEMHINFWYSHMVTIIGEEEIQSMHWIGEAEVFVNGRGGDGIPLRHLYIIFYLGD